MEEDRIPNTTLDITNGVNRADALLTQIRSTKCNATASYLTVNVTSQLLTVMKSN